MLDDLSDIGGGKGLAQISVNDDKLNGLDDFDDDDDDDDDDWNF